MSDDFETVREVLENEFGKRGGVPWADDAHEALDRIEARLSTTEEALREISASLYLGDEYNELRRIARNALQPEHQKASSTERPELNPKVGKTQKEPIDR